MHRQHYKSQRLSPRHPGVVSHPHTSTQATSQSLPPQKHSKPPPPLPDTAPPPPIFPRTRQGYVVFPDVQPPASLAAKLATLNAAQPPQLPPKPQSQMPAVCLMNSCFHLVIRRQLPPKPRSLSFSVDTKPVSVCFCHHALSSLPKPPRPEKEVVPPKPAAPPLASFSSSIPSS